VEQVLALGRRYPEVTSWVRANTNDLKLVTGLGLRETGILTSSSDYHIKSGAAGMAYWVNHHLGLTGEAQLDKKHPAVIAMAAWVEAQYRQGRTTAIASEEMLGLMQEHLPAYVRGKEPEVGPALSS
jgi:hypothetical protein